MAYEALANKSGDECHAMLVDITERNLAEEIYGIVNTILRSNPCPMSVPARIMTGELRVSDELLRIMNIVGRSYSGSHGEPD
jgi:hypothetical protein